jgi:GYF domain 2
VAEEWIVRVEGQEYGPVDIDELREWQREGRLIPDNPVRREGDPVWIKAAEIPGIFPVVEIQHPQAVRRSLSQIIVESFRIYRRGFPQFLVLALVTALPSVCAQLSAPPVDISANVVPDLRMVAAVGFSFLMLLLSLALWPVFIIGIQIITADLMAARPVRIPDLLRRVLPFWPRVALLCLFVYGSYFFWTALPLAAILGIALAGPSVLSLFLLLLLLAFQVWMTARLFTNFLFWQQFAVIGQSNITDTLRQSKELGRSGSDRSWYQRPLWRGAVLASIWCAVVIILNIGPEWQLVRTYFHQLTTSQDPQAMIQALSSSKPPSANVFTILLGLFQVVLRPLLGISFVVLYFDARNESGVTPPS